MNLLARYPKIESYRLRIAARTLECRLTLFKENTVSRFLMAITKFLILAKEMTFLVTSNDRVPMIPLSQYRQSMLKSRDFYNNLVPFDIIQHINTVVIRHLK